MSDLFPLDVNYGRVGTWLQERHKLPADWLKKLQAFQRKVAEAALELPPGFLSQLEGGDDVPMDYFRARQIRDRLAETSEYGLFGRLAGSAGVWDKLVRTAEKSLVYLGEAGQSLAQNVDFEIPYLKRQAETLDKQISECDRKHGDCLKSATSGATAFRHECEALGMAGVDVRSEVVKYSDSVFTVLQRAVDATKSPKIEEAISYYARFSSHVHGEEATISLASLTKVRMNQVEAPTRSIAETPAVKTSSGNEENNNGNQSEEAAASGIDWDFDVDPTGAVERSGTGIDWDFEMVEAPEEEGEGASSAEEVVGKEAINWGIDVAIEAEGGGEEGAGGVGIDWDVSEEQSKPEVESTSPKDAISEVERNASNAVLRIVWDAVFRSELLDELLELKSFLTMRQAGLEGENLGFIMLPHDLQGIDARQIGGLLESVQVAVDGLTSKEPRQLLMLKTSSRWLERMVGDLEKKAGQEARWRKSAMQLERRRKELQKNLMSNSLKLAALTKRTKTIKAEVEKGISSIFGGRQINICGDMGGI
ncbi:hypothetical protein BSKO_04706 [Bryopsis sp. KO-2023]|nr:hypothetical protein BSKO_04706 [Bryopsis sp. KO-2023]